MRQEDRRVELQCMRKSPALRERWEAERQFPASNHLDLLCRSRLLSFWLRHNRQAAMSRRIYRAHSEYDIILRNLQGCTRTATHRLYVLPIRRFRRAPDHLVGGRSSSKVPTLRSCHCRDPWSAFSHLPAALEPTPAKPGWPRSAGRRAPHSRSPTNFDKSPYSMPFSVRGV